MNINNIYEVFIFIKRYNSITKKFENYFCEVTLVEKKKTAEGYIYCDIKTGINYPVKSSLEAEANVFYINSSHGLIPYNRVVEIKKTYISKRRALKKYREQREKKY